MPLVLEEVKLSDFPKIASYIDPSDQGDDLVSPAVSPAFPVTNEEDARARIALSNKQQEDFLRLDPTTRIAKVVDTDQGANEIIALARWNRYQEGFKASRLDYCGDADPDEGSSWPEGMDVKFYKELCDAVYLHADWMGKGPYWLLGVLVTRAPHRRRGAGRMLVRYGVQKAQEEGVPAYVEATADGKLLYESEGFKQVGVCRVNADLAFVQMAANRD